MIARAQKIWPALAFGGPLGLWIPEGRWKSWFSKEHKRLSVFPNGAAEGKLELNASCYDDLRKQIQKSNYFSEFSSFRLFAMSGLLDERTFQMLETGSDVYVVPEGLQFRWPVRHLGDKIVVDGMHDRDNPQDVTMTLVSKAPVVFVIDNLFNERDINELKSWATDPRNPLPFEPKYVQGSGENRLHNPSGTVDVFWPGRRRMSDRVFRLLRIPPDLNKYDGNHIVRYRKGQALVDHLDWIDTDIKFAFNPDPSQGGTNRHATVFTLLSDVPEFAGGMTIFPMATEFIHPDVPTVAGGCEATQAAEHLFAENTWERLMARRCFKGEHLAIQPRRGRTILFYHQDGMTGHMDETAIHGGCPVVKDGFEKWGVTAWVWNGRQQNPDILRHEARS